jgi:hypothetical protein
MGFLVPSHTARNIGEGHTRLQVHFDTILRTFGSPELHVVAWSKGGLWTRDALAFRSLPIKTLTTISTPHNGAFDNTLTISCVLAAVSDEARQICDLSPSSVAWASRHWGVSPHSYLLPGKPSVRSRYYWIAGAADSDGNGTISCAESAGLAGIECAPSASPSSENFLATVTYQAAGCSARLTFSPGERPLRISLFPSIPPTCGPTEPSDIIVKVSSSSFPAAFTPISGSFASSVLPRNHTTVINSATGDFVRAKILESQQLNF